MGPVDDGVERAVKISLGLADGPSETVPFLETILSRSDLPLNRGSEFRSGGSKCIPAIRCMYNKNTGPHDWSKAPAGCRFKPGYLERTMIGVGFRRVFVPS